MCEQREVYQQLQIERPEPFHLVCLGSSLSGYHAITLDAVRHLQAARRVFLYPLNEDHLVFLRRFNPAIVDLNRTLYVDGIDCADAYQDIINVVLSEARAGSVAYVSQGSPIFQTYTAFELVRRARAEGLTARILPGVSSLECLLATVGIAQPIDELQLYTCRAVVADEARPDPRAPCLLFNVSVYAAAVVNTRGYLMQRERLEALTSALAAIYPADHQVSLMHIEPAGGISVVTSSIARLSDSLASSQPGITLYVNAVRGAYSQEK